MQKATSTLAVSDTSKLIVEAKVTTDFSPAYLSLLGSSLLTACAEDSSSSSSMSDKERVAGALNTSSLHGKAIGYLPPGAVTDGLTFSAPGFNNYPQPTSDADAVRFLLQSQFNASPAEITTVASSTFASYLQEQFAKPPGQTGWDWLEACGYGVSDINSYFDRSYQADGMIWNQLMTSPDAMRKRMALALSEFFVVSLQSAEFSWRSHAFAQYWDTLVSNAFGNYRQLLEAVTLNPAMGHFLNTKGNQKENIRTGRVPDENYGREVMQLFTIGLYMLNLDGTIQTDVDGKRLETYTQNDVTNIARVFTGYDFDTSDGERITPVGQTYTIESRAFTRKPMSLNEAKHSTLASDFLGTSIPAGTGGAQALKTALDTLFNHTNVGPFFGKQMIQRLVTSNPSPAYVARVAAAFNDNGTGVRGDLKAVWTAIFLDDEARRAFLFTPSTAQPPPAPTDPNDINDQKGLLNRNIRDLNFGKLREPMLRFVQWGRTFGLSPVNASYQYWKIPDTSSISDSLAQSPLRSPSVFNFFRPGFVPPSTSLAARNTPAPEFQIVNETTVGGYLNFMQTVIRSGLSSYIDPAVPQASYPASFPYTRHLSATYAQELTLANNPTALVKHLNLIMCAGQITDENEALMISALSSMPVNSAVDATVLSQQLDRIAAGVLMVMACSEYLIQK